MGLLVAPYYTNTYKNTIQIWEKVGYIWIKKKSDFVGQNTMMIIFVDQIYINALPIRQVFPKQVFGKMPCFGPHLVRKVANLQKCNAKM